MYRSSSSTLIPCHSNIQFTWEKESKNKISFLDISVTRINNKLSTSLYRKKTFGSVYLNFNSFLPMDDKKGLVHNLLFRAFNICADFPLFFVDNSIKKILNKLFVKQNISGAVSKKN